MRRMLGVGLVLLLLIGTVSPVVIAELGTDSSHAAFITYEYGDHEVGSEVNVTVHVFEAGEYFDPDGLDLEVRESGREVDLIRSSTGVYQGSFEIVWEDLSEGMFIYLDASIGMTSEYSLYVSAAVITAYSRFHVGLIWLEPAEGDLRPGQVVSLEAQITYQGEFVDPDPGSLVIGFREREEEDPPDLKTTRVAKGRYRASYTIPSNITSSKMYEIGTSANLTITILTAHGDEEHTERTGGWSSYGMDPLELWANVYGISREEILLDLYIRDTEGQPVVDANVSLEFSYMESYWDGILFGSDDGTTGKNGSVPFSINITNISANAAYLLIEGNITHNNTYQEIDKILFLAESPETFLGGQAEFYVTIIDEEMSYDNGSLWLKNEVMSNGTRMSGADVYTYTVTDFDVINHSAHTTNGSGVIEVEFDFPEDVEYGTYPGSYPTTYYHSQVNGSYYSTGETYFSFGPVDPEKYSWPYELAQTVLQVGSAAPGDDLSIEFSNTLVDGVNDIGTVLWSIANNPIDFRSSHTEWTRLNRLPAVPTGGYLECQWTGDSYTTNLTVPDFLPNGTEILIIPWISRLDEVRGDIMGPYEWVTVSEAVGGTMVSITEPVDNETVNGIITIRGESSSDNTIESVQMQINDYGWETVDMTGEWSYELDTTKLGYGNFTIQVRAFDGTTYSELAIIRVHVDNPPSVNVGDPSQWSIINDSLLAAGNAVDDLWPTKVEVRIDGGDWVEEIPGSQGYPSPIIWYHAIDLATIPHGEHTLEVRAFDGTNYSPIVITEFFTNRAPAVIIEHPVVGGVHTDDLKVDGTASDDLKVEHVEMRIGDGDWTVVEGTGEWSYELDLSGYMEGNLTIEVRAFDGTQYSDPVEVTITVEEDEPSPSTTGISLWPFMLVIVIALGLGIVVWYRSQRQ